MEEFNRIKKFIRKYPIGCTMFTLVVISIIGIITWKYITVPLASKDLIIGGFWAGSMLVTLYFTGIDLYNIYHDYDEPSHDEK